MEPVFKPMLKIKLAILSLHVFLLAACDEPAQQAESTGSASMPVDRANGVTSTTTMNSVSSSSPNLNSGVSHIGQSTVHLLQPQLSDGSLLSTETTHIPADTIAKLAICGVAGDIQLQGGSEDFIITLNESNATLFSLSPGELKVKRVGSTIAVYSESTDPTSFQSTVSNDCQGSTAAYDLVISIPNSIGLSIADAMGDIRIASLEANSLSIADGSGDIHLEAVQADNLSVADGSGDINLNDISTQDISLADGSGDIHLEALQADSLSIADGSGDLTEYDIQVVSQSIADGSGQVSITKAIGDIRISDGSGDIVLEAHRGQFYLEQDTVGAVWVNGQLVYR